MKIENDIHKIIFEQDETKGIILKLWKKGFIHDAPPNRCDYITNISMLELCQKLEKSYGFTVSMSSCDKGLAMRGEIIRIDFITILQGEIKVCKYPYGWTMDTKPFSEIKPLGFDLLAAIDWCKKNGWIVNEKNKQHIIAQKGIYHPIRSRQQILSRRRYLKKENIGSAFYDNQQYYSDLAFDP